METTHNGSPWSSSLSRKQQQSSLSSIQGQKDVETHYWEGTYDRKGISRSRIVHTYTHIFNF